MKAIAITVTVLMGLFFVATGSVQAHWKPGDVYGYCKSGKGVKDVKDCKENGGRL